MDENLNDARVARKEHGSTIWREGQNDTWGQEDEQNCGYNQVGDRQCEFKNKFDDDP